jgi:single-strand DNA-binding protein
MSVNSVTLLGHLGRDPELRFTPSQIAVTTLSVATSEKYKAKDGTTTSHTEWHKVIVWGQSGEWLSQNAKKGSQVYVEGSISTRKWQDKSGQTRYTTEIKANRVELVGARKGEDEAAEAVAHKQMGFDHPSTSPFQSMPLGEEDIPF